MEAKSNTLVYVAILRACIRSEEVPKILPKHPNTPVGHTHGFAIGIQMGIDEAYDEALL